MARRRDWGVKACMMEAGSIDELFFQIISVR